VLAHGSRQPRSWLIFNVGQKHEHQKRSFCHFSEFCPDRGIPRDERLASKFPQLSNDEISEWLNEFKVVESRAYDLAVENRRLNLKPKQTIQKIKEAFPFLKDDAAENAFNQAMYFVWKDGE
jgi:hypothetical protein